MKVSKVKNRNKASKNLYDEIMDVNEAEQKFYSIEHFD